MSGFLDSNVILYLAQDDARRAGIAETLLADGATISVQVLNEITHVTRRKCGYDWRQAAALIDNVIPWCA